MHAVPHAISAVVLGAAAALSSSAAASTTDQLAVAPTSTALALPSSNSSVIVTATDSTKISPLRTCGGMWNTNWDNVDIACAWDHSWELDQNYNLFFYFFDGHIVKECNCDKGLSTYGAWSSKWWGTWSGKVYCYTRDHKSAAEVKGIFDNVHC